jgi:ABC-type dipeptide/oligopeptide/nickel transport system permease subunit
MKKSKSDATITLLVITVGFLIVYLLTKWDWTIYTSVIIGLLGLSSGYLREKIDFLWTKLSWLLSYIVPNILLSIIFYVFLFPIALLSRIFGEKDPMRFRNTTNSVYKSSNKHFDKHSFERPW